MKGSPPRNGQGQKKTNKWVLNRLIGMKGGRKLWDGKDINEKKIDKGGKRGILGRVG